MLIVGVPYSQNTATIMSQRDSPPDNPGIRTSQRDSVGHQRCTDLGSASSSHWKLPVADAEAITLSGLKKVKPQVQIMSSSNCFSQDRHFLRKFLWIRAGQALHNGGDQRRCLPGWAFGPKGCCWMVQTPRLKRWIWHWLRKRRR